MGGAKNGIFTPLVRVVKRLVGKERFLSFRGRVIGAHTKVIQAFVDTSDSPFGCLALEKLFEMADLDGDGAMGESDLEACLRRLQIELPAESRAIMMADAGFASGATSKELLRLVIKGEPDAQDQERKTK